MHCDECFEADEFFQHHTAASLANVVDPPETLPLAFLTEQAFRFMLPALVRMLAKDPQASDVLMLIENRLHILLGEEAAALHDALYALYESRQSDFHDGFYSYETLWRILDRLDARM
ncbi:MAG TPA: hypothetical protein VER03_16735 [Bryobacteraceae bacterium]|nr:hypothetical protein [Bryobacteraceae bacterium]